MANPNIVADRSNLRNGWRYPGCKTVSVIVGSPLETVAKIEDFIMQIEKRTG